MDCYGTARQWRYPMEDYCKIHELDKQLTTEEIDKKKRFLIEEELKKIPEADRHDLHIYMTYSNVARNQPTKLIVGFKIRYTQDAIRGGTDRLDLNHCTDRNTNVWAGFDFTPFYSTCQVCKLRCDAYNSVTCDKCVTDNEKAKREIIEAELEKIPIADRHELDIYMKCIDSSKYVSDLTSIKVVKSDINPDTKTKSTLFEFEWWCMRANPEVWAGFDRAPFYQKCRDCGKNVGGYQPLRNVYRKVCTGCSNNLVHVTVPKHEEHVAKKLGVLWHEVKRIWYVSYRCRNVEEIIRWSDTNSEWYHSLSG